MSGVVSSDGSPVAAYAALPAEPELSVVREFVTGHERVLDLGCGTGRIADPLARAGFDVVAVDESADMLAHVRNAVAVCSRIEDLDAGRTFDAVLLLSHLINGVHAAALVDVAARHLADDGVLVVQRLEPGRTWQPESGLVGPVTIAQTDVVVDGQRIDGSTRYSVGGRSWLQRWTMWERDDAQIEELLAAVGLRLASASGAWVTATRAR